MTTSLRAFLVFVIAIAVLGLPASFASAAESDTRVGLKAVGRPTTDGTFMFDTVSGLTATIENADGPVSGGQAVLFLGDKWAGNASVSNGEAAFWWRAPAAGTYTFTVHYNNAAGVPVTNSGPVPITVARMQTQVSVQKQSYDHPAGVPMSLSLSLAYAEGIPALKEQGVYSHGTSSPTGKATLTIGGHSYTTNVSARTFDIPALGGGSHAAKVTYSGDANFEPSEWVGNITLDKNRTQLPGDFSCAPAPGGTVRLQDCLPKLQANQDLRYYVDPTADLSSKYLSVKPTGWATVSLNGKEVGRSSLVDGKASVHVAGPTWTSAANSGVQRFVINYSGDENFEPATASYSYWLVEPSTPQEGGAQVNGYRLLTSSAGAKNYGVSAIPGSEGISLSAPAVGGASTVTRNGYWAVASDGGIFSFGDARFFGSMGGQKLNKPVVSMAPTPNGNGYWLVASDGGVFSFGDAQFFGSTGSISLNKPVVGITSTPSGKGYWLVASDGGIFSYGDAKFFGSTGSIRLNKPVVGMTTTPAGDGYRMVASDGGVFSFGNAAFYGSTGANPIDRPILAMSSTRSGSGYWITADDGRVFAFGDAWSAPGAHNPVGPPGAIVGLLG